MRLSSVLTAVSIVLAVGAWGAPAAEAAQCTISTTPVVFGIYNVFTAAPLDTVGTVTYECNGGAKHVVVSISRGQGSTFAQRAMRKFGGTDRLYYNLFLDASRTAVWGDGSPGTQVHSGGNPPNKQVVAVPVYGRIPPAQDISAGVYFDAVAVEINF
jgi:spore coat protein U-like protein